MSDLVATLQRARDALSEAVLQIEYLHGRWKETGSGDAAIARSNSAIADIDAALAGAGKTVVTDAMVDAALGAWFPETDDEPWSYMLTDTPHLVSKFRGEMREALEAAIDVAPPADPQSAAEPATDAPVTISGEVEF